MPLKFPGFRSMTKLIKSFTFFWFCSTLLSFLISSSAANTLLANRSIREGETIVSLAGNFELGFFSLGSSMNRYLCIRYKKMASGTVVWVANRETPLTNTTGVLKLSSKGTLVLLSGTDSIIWSSNSSISLKNPVAQLLDSGNLVIRNEKDIDPGNFFWQSFDFPGNTFLPGMKLGRDLVAGLDRTLNSWKSNDDPSLGNYTIHLDIIGYPQIFLRQGSAIIFRVGPWNGNGFSGMPIVGRNEIFTYQFVLNEKEIYYKYELINSSILMRITMKPEGPVERFTWIERTQKWELYVPLQVDICDNYARCGVYGSCDINKAPTCGCLKGFEPRFAEDWENADWKNGCVRKTQLNCGDGDRFMKYSDRKLPDTRNSWFNVSMNIKECKRMCLKNCSCTAYANTNISGRGSGCLLWFGDLIDIREQKESPQDLYVRLAASEFESDSRSKVKRLVLITIFPVLLIMTVLLGRCLWYVFKYRKQNREEEMTLNVENTCTYENGREDLPLFDFRTIANATNNFSINCKLGEGGFGPVYKGILNDGQEIAVKRLSTSSRQGVEEFTNEVSCIAKLQHRNLVRLLGCSTEEGERMLIYEYMPNKSLDYFIFGDNEQKKSLDWQKRYNIINGIARGLLYLHQDSRLRIIHRDLKASNILLDYEMNPRISDFGMARSFGGSETEANTTRVVGTYGYMPPEYAIDGLFSVKSDVYSFGVLVIEIVSGKKNRFFNHPDHNLNLLGHAWRSYKEDKLLELIDGAILESINEYEVFRIILIGLLCVQQYAEDRPNMSHVMLMLSSKIPLAHPKQPGFFTERKLCESDSSLSKLKADCSPNMHDSSSSNQLSVTFLAPR